MDHQITTFLLLQLLKTWHPDVIALAGLTPNKLSKTPKLQTPPLIAMLARLADAPVTPYQPESKELPCGHRVDVRSILSRSNLFGDLVWGRGRHFLHCPHPDCNRRYALPMIPNPWVVAGLEARLDLIQWVWARDKHAPNKVDVKMVRILRYVLNHIGNLPQDLEMTSSSPWSGSSERRLGQTLRLFDKEGVAGAVGKIYAGPGLLRGTQHYCKSRPSRAPPPGYVQFKYHPPSPGEYCACKEPHNWARNPRDWASTPAEDEEEWGFAICRIERKTRKFKRKKTVRFAAPVITSIQYFEPWWRSEYRDSDRYYSSGPCRTSVDPSTKVDDDKEVARLDARALAAERPKTNVRLL
ncbi:MAG: hypothetical protein Q9175_002503 [Cornicularia normoerica]